jgi:hypothetical protein
MRFENNKEEAKLEKKENQEVQATLLAAGVSATMPNGHKRLASLHASESVCP